MMESMQAEAVDFKTHPGRSVFELVLSWVIRGDGDGLGLRGKVVDVVCLGLQVFSHDWPVTVTIPCSCRHTIHIKCSFRDRCFTYILR